MSKIIEAWDGAEFESLAKLTLSRFKRKDVRSAIRESQYATKLLELASSGKLAPAPAATSNVPPRVVSILHSSLPSHTGGYTGRAQGILKGLANRGVEVRPYTRPGFYEETVDKKAVFPYPVQSVDGVEYRHLPTDFARAKGDFEYMYRSIPWYRKAIMAERPDVVHLRSTYLVALPALIAAHSLSVPTVYEVSGLWELVYEGRGEVGRSRRAQRLEDAVCASSDRVVTMNRSMSDLLKARSNGALDIGLVPNAVDLKKFSTTPPLESQQDFQFDVGYIGSIVDYEGLDCLIEAIAYAKNHLGREIKSKIVGDGNVRSQLEALSRRLNVQDQIDFTGRVPAEIAVRQYDDVNLVVLPRYSTPATEIVTPLKPFEAMAAGRPLVVSSVSALNEVSRDGRCAVVFETGNSKDLAVKIVETLDDKTKQKSMVTAAKSLVSQDHNWDTVANKFKSEIEGLRRAKGNLPFLDSVETWDRVGRLSIKRSSF